MRDRQTCIGCGKKSPETETNYTLISAQFGWRLSRYRNPDGTIMIEWRCPSCWREYKKAKDAAPSSSSGAHDTPADPQVPRRASSPVPAPPSRSGGTSSSVPPPSHTPPLTPGSAKTVPPKTTRR